MSVQILINQMTVLFLLLAIGFIVGKTKILTPEGNKILSKLVLFITLPCTILSSVFENEMDITAFDTFYFLLMAALTFIIAFAIALPVARFVGGDKANRGMLGFMSVFSNAGFMGFPVVISIFGVFAAYYVALFNILFNALIFSVGIMMISGKVPGSAADTVDASNPSAAPGAGPRTGPGSPENPTNARLRGFNPKLLINPTLITSVLAIPITLTGISFPAIITEAAKITGSITTPGAMLVIGSTLAYVPLKSIFSEWRIAPVMLARLIVIPFITWLILSQIITNEYLLGILVIISAMPIATMSSMLAVEYGGNEKLASAGVFVTTLLCGITVPLIVHLLLT
ncbi:MAG: AEC family transporter [Oscillospiraceae bacterium]|jgi:predicted permease|nr:AEC family transporter [Oscillospiraceae bacterium]